MGTKESRQTSPVDRCGINLRQMLREEILRSEVVNLHQEAKKYAETSVRKISKVENASSGRAWI
eukprot:11857401-Ditylum_brightwellii.AAC.1